MQKKIIVQIPCHNEEKTLAATIRDIPKIINKHEIEILIIDDGSTDKTVDVAKNLKVNHIIQNHKKLGLAKSFINGINECLKLNADIIVNTDADNQYLGSDIAKLVEPLLNKNSDMVVGCRNILKNPDFSYLKKKLQVLGSSVVRFASNTNITDATSGFRAYTADIAKYINVYDDYTYTLETLIQVGLSKNFRVSGVSISTNRQTRPSRLLKSNFQYIIRSIGTIYRSYVLYKPLSFFTKTSLIFFLIGFFICLRYLLNTYVFEITDRTYIPSLILAVISFLISLTTLFLGTLGWINSVNRELLERIIDNKNKNKFD